MVLELERACYNEMERESMEYFYAAEKELQRQRALYFITTKEKAKVFQAF